MSTRAGTSKPNALDQKNLEAEEDAERGQPAAAKELSLSSELLDTRAPLAAVKKKVVPSEEEVLKLGRMVVLHRGLKCPPPCSAGGPEHLATMAPGEK